MRRKSRPATWAIISLALALSACGHKATAPDPNAAMLGTWTGTLTETTQGPLGPDVRQFALTIEIGNGGLGSTLDGAPHWAAVDAMHDPDLSFVVANGLLLVTHTAARTGDSMTGHAD